MTAKRYHDLDALRAFAMLLGILLHGLLSFVGWPIWPAQDINQSELYFIPLMFIHGFRMSLFFFVSGFFTMMMWQKRGSVGLLAHRAKRIVLPFFALGFLVFPMLNNMKSFADWVGEGREERVVESSEGKEADNPQYEVPNDLGGAARQGDLESIVKFLDEGADIDGKYDKDFTPLHWAAAAGKAEAVNLLAEKGANLDSRDQAQSTPILVSAFLGRTECVRILLAKGADPELRNVYQSRPLEAMSTDRTTTVYVAENILQIPIKWSEVQKGRRYVVKLLTSEKIPHEPNKSVDEMNLWEAVREGEVERVSELIDLETAFPNQKDNKQISALQWASLSGQTKVIELLVEKGAKVNTNDSWYGATPLHFAALFGQPESVETLLSLGADPMLESDAGIQPIALAYVDQSMTERFVEFLLLDIDIDEIEKGREEVIEKLGGLPPASAPIASPLLSLAGWFLRNYMPDGRFITHHLWFLYDLVYLVLAFVLVASSLKYFPLAGLPKWLAQSPLRLLWLVPLTYWAQYSMGGGGEDGLFGPSTAVWLEPDWIKLSYYGIFFGYGAICFQHKGFHEKVGRFWPIHLFVSVVVFLTALSLMERTDLEFRYEIISLCASLFVWLMIFGLIGVFRKFFSGESPKVRFVSDSAYWLYLAHLPLIQVVQIWVSEWPLPSLIKVVIVCVVTTVLLLLSYRYLIRYTPVGTMLNGKRTLPSAG